MTIIAPTPHEKPETTACGTLATYRPSRSTQKIIMKTDAARQTLAAPPTPSSRTAAGDERHGGAGRAADQDGVAAQQRGDRRGQDRREQAEFGRQAHQLGQGQAVGQRDQGGDRAARGVSGQAAPAIRPAPAIAAPRSGQTFITLAKAARNFAISSRVPIVTRTWLGIDGQVRPMATFSLSMAWPNSRPGRRTSTMIMFASEGRTAKPFLSSHPAVSSRMSAMIFRRVATRPLTLRLAMAPTMPVDRQGPGAVALDLGEQVGPRQRRAGAEAGHAVELGERPQDDHVLVGRDQRASPARPCCERWM